MRKRDLLPVGLGVAATLALAGSAQGAVMIGSDLMTMASANTPGCDVPCTAANRVLGVGAAPGGLTSPANGTVTSWRLGANTAPNVSLRILRPGGGNTFTGAGTSGPAGFAGPGISGPIPAALAINAGDSIGLESPNGNLIYGANISGGAIFWNGPPLAEGSTRAPSGNDPMSEVLVQATVEPTNTLGLSAPPVLNKKKGTATLTISVPNPGQLDFSGTGINIAETAAVKTVTAPGPVKFLISAAGKKRKKLNRKGKVGVTASFTFTPTGGAPNTQSTTLQLKKKLKRRR